MNEAETAAQITSQTNLGTRMRVIKTPRIEKMSISVEARSS
jgi:hypothetical protein